MDEVQATSPVEETSMLTASTAEYFNLSFTPPASPTNCENAEKSEKRRSGRVSLSDWWGDGAEQPDAASATASSSGQAISTRILTGYARSDPEEEHRGLQFNDQAEQLDPASAATGSAAKSIRSQINLREFV